MRSGFSRPRSCSPQHAHVAALQGHQRLLNREGLEHLGDGRAPEIVRRDLPLRRRSRPGARRASAPGAVSDLSWTGVRWLFCGWKSHAAGPSATSAILRGASRRRYSSTRSFMSWGSGRRSPLPRQLGVSPGVRVRCRGQTVAVGVRDVPAGAERWPQPSHLFVQR